MEWWHATDQRRNEEPLEEQWLLESGPEKRSDWRALPDGVTNFDDIDRNAALESVTRPFALNLTRKHSTRIPRTIHMAEAHSLAAAQVATTRASGIYCDSMSAICNAKKAHNALPRALARMACCAAAASLAATRTNNWPILKIKSHADGDEIQQGIHSLADAVADNCNDGAEPSAIMVVDLQKGGNNGWPRMLRAPD
jgi:hypothetical protein